MQKSQLLERTNQGEAIKDALGSNRHRKISVTELVDMAERVVDEKTHDILNAGEERSRDRKQRIHSEKIQ